jgi:hypothetical protein
VLQPRKVFLSPIPPSLFSDTLEAWPVLIRSAVIDYLLGHVGQSKSFVNIVLPLFGNLKFEKPDLYDVCTIELDS